MDVILEFYDSYRKSLKDMSNIISRVLLPKEIKILPTDSSYKEGYRIELKGCKFHKADDLLKVLEDNKLYMSHVTEYSIKYSNKEKKMLEKSIVVDEL